MPTLLGLAVGGAVAQDRAKLFLFEDVGGRGAFGGRWGSLGRAGCREVCAASREAAFERLGRWEDPLKKGMATHSTILAWRIPGMGEPGGLLSMGSQRVGHD